MVKSVRSEPLDTQMGNLLSNKSEYENNENYHVCDATRLQSRLLKHRNNSKIIEILEHLPVACNYMFDPTNFVTETDIFAVYNHAKRPLYFHLGVLRFCPGCKIVLSKELYEKIIELENSKSLVQFNDKDTLRVLGWVHQSNFFL